MTLINHPSAIPADELESKPIEPPVALQEQAIPVRSKVHFKNDESTVISGVWESEPGVSRWEFLNRGEIIHVLSGAMTVQEDGGEPEQITAGTTAYFPFGWQGTWTVTETIRKFYVVYKQP